MNDLVPTAPDGSLIIPGSPQFKEFIDKAVDEGNYSVLKSISNQQAAFFPFVPVIRPNGKYGPESEYKTRFLIDHKDGSDWYKSEYRDEFQAIVLFERLQVKEKYRDDKPYTWFSPEFDWWDKKLRVYNKDTKALEFEGYFHEFKNHPKFISRDEHNQKDGNKYTVHSILYVLIANNELPEGINRDPNLPERLYRIDLTGTSMSEWMGFKNKFSANELWLGTPIKFTTVKETKGSNEFHRAELSKGEALGKDKIKEHAYIAGELRYTLKIVDDNYNPKIDQEGADDGAPTEAEVVMDDEPAVNTAPPADDDDEIKPEDIPF